MVSSSWCWSIQDVCATPGEENSATQGEKLFRSKKHYPGSSGSFSGNSPSSISVPTATPVADNSRDLTTDQKIIKTSQITIEIKNVTTTLEPLKNIASAKGGYIGSLSVNSRDGNRMYAVLTMRVPAQAFDSAITDIKALGSLKSKSLRASDVTEMWTCMHKGLPLPVGLTQYNRVMEKAVNVSEILQVQVQIERVQVEIDRIDGRLKYLDNRVDYATITVSLEEPEPVGGGEGISFIFVINQGIAGFLAVTAGLIVFLISIVPLIILGIIAYVIFRWWKREKGCDKKNT